MKVIKETCTKGMNIYLGNKKREVLNKCIDILLAEDFVEIQFPIIQDAGIFKNKVGQENNNMMYTLTDKKGRDLALAPEYTSVLINMEDTFKYQKDVKLFYVAECFRGENPQKGRFRQFTQLGVEILNPTKDYDLVSVAINLARQFTQDTLEVDETVTRGLDYYKGGIGFELRTEDGFQIVGGGSYKNGIGFAIGVDRLLAVSNLKE